MRFLLVLFLFPLTTFAQNDSCHLRISLLTCTPGEELYSTFGHSALRITDSVSNSDIVYNYGTFNFEEPGFYTKFIRGKLTFYISTYSFDSFVDEYRQDKRGITEQVLNLTCNEKYKIFDLLKTNTLPANIFYKYDFAFDNCTTRLRYLIEKSADTSIHFRNVLQSKKTFRDLIYEYLNKNDKQWSKLGIDVLLGSKMDEIIKPKEVMFLPDYLLKTFDSSAIESRPLIIKKQIVVAPATSTVAVNYFTHPFFIFTVDFLIIVLLSFSRNHLIKRILTAFDGFLFFMTGLLGILLVFMWVGTDHMMCKENFNLLWAWPTNAIAAFFIQSRNKIGKYYFTIYSIFNAVFVACWFLLPQHMNPAIIPIIGILVFRSILYISTKK